jgi:hypothetical protein
MAEQAAVTGDFTSADALLGEAARLQEAERGPNDPDLATTLTNLAIVAEKTARTSDAETWYRRAAAVAAASLPSDHPIVVESRKNLEDFCREHGLAIADAVVTAAAEDRSHAPEAPVQRPTRSSASPAWVLAAVVILIALIAAAVLVNRSGRPSESSTTAVPVQHEPPIRSTPATVPPVADPPVADPRVAEPPATKPPPPDLAPPAAARPGQADERRPAASDRSSSPVAVELVTAQLCQTFSTSGAAWQCDPRGEEVATGPLVLYTRVRSPTDTTIEHRWYRGDTLRQAVRLNVRANAAEGYRTYSRQTVNGGDWRVEIRNARGDVLHTEQFAVR